LGAHGWRLWWEVRLTLLRPAIMAAGALVFIFCFTSFGVVLLLGGPRYATLEVEIFRQARDLFNLPVAAALSLVQIVLMFVLMWVYTRLQRRISGEIVAASAVAQSPRTLRERLTVGAMLFFMALLLFTPLLALALLSFTLGSDGISLQNYAALGVNLRGSVLFVPPSEAIGNSLLFAIASTAIAVVLGVASAYLLTSNTRWSRLLDAFFMLPLAASAVTLGFGFIIALDEPPLDLRGSVVLIPIAHALVAIPFVIRSVLPSLRALPPSVLEAASVLGASPWRRWRWIELPLISRALLVGATFAFTVSMGEFGASLFIARPDTPTLPIAIYRLLGQPGGSAYGQALALSTILLAVAAVAFILIERLRTTDRGEF
jgi:thiamine transport system permease protein